ncbi:MAG: tRNA adenosine(34) deaminase TadA [Robiginitomaculum sp.]|nr:tRNA adenosine(34) deaminase TadA [Robiginitomaculum sp.]
MNDEHYMRQCIAQAQAASARGEVPVGALIVDPASGDIIARTGNAPIGICDPTAHAEILALRDAAYKIDNYRLSGLTLYVTLEPCTMCAGAISNARIARVVYGASDPKGGAVENGVQFFSSKSCHSKPEVTSGVLADVCGQLLKDFFKARRKRGGEVRQRGK